MRNKARVLGCLLVGTSVISLAQPTAAAAVQARFTGVAPLTEACQVGAGSIARASEVRVARPSFASTAYE